MALNSSLFTLQSREAQMNPGEFLCQPGSIEINQGRKTIELDVENTGDRPIQVGSHYHFFETNSALNFDREEAKGRQK